MYAVSEGLRYRTYIVRTTPIHLDDVHCTGEEESLFQCRHNGVGVHDCGGTDGVSAICYNGKITCRHFSGKKFNPKNNVIAVHSQILDVKMEIYV